MKTILLFIGNVFFNALGNILMKYGTGSMGSLNFKSVESIWSNIVLNPPLISGIFCYGFSLVFYIAVLQKVDLSIAYPIVVSCTAIFVNVTARFLFHESITWVQVAGCVIVILGIYLIVRN